MIKIPIVDAHLHLWDRSLLRYSWLEGVPALDREFLLSDYHAATEAVQIDKIVFLEADCAPEQFQAETDWVTALAKEDPRIEGIVARASLEECDQIRPALEQLAANTLVKGIRREIEPETDPEFCLQPDFVKGVQLLADFDLSFDICIKHHQLANVVKFVSLCPDVRFVLDHIGKPDIKNGLLHPWKEDMKDLADLPNVWCKISGVATEADHQSWTREDLRPYILHAIDCFGFDRVFYAGDWPVATLATDYCRWVETLEWCVQDASEHELRKLFHDSAAAFYRL